MRRRADRRPNNTGRCRRSSAPWHWRRYGLATTREKLAKDAVFQVAEALKNLSAETAEKVIAEARRDYFGKGRQQDRPANARQRTQ
jgi:hypothetical protein